MWRRRVRRSATRSRPRRRLGWARLLRRTWRRPHGRGGHKRRHRDRVIAVSRGGGRRRPSADRAEWTGAKAKAGALGGLDNLVVEHGQGRAEDDPLDHVLVPFPERLPYCRGAMQRNQRSEWKRDDGNRSRRQLRLAGRAGGRKEAGLTGFFLVRLASNGDPGSAARLGRVLLDPTELDPLRWDQVPRVAAGERRGSVSPPSLHLVDR